MLGCLNIRGNAQNTPTPHSYILIDKKNNIKLFCDINKISLPLRRYLKKVEFIKIDLIEKVLSKIKKKKFIIDRNTCSYYFENIIFKKNKILDYPDPIYFLKAIKSKKEIRNIKLAHIYDGVSYNKISILG